MLQAKIVVQSEVVPAARGRGVTTRPLVTADLGSTQLLNGVTEFAPGTSLPLHSHNTEESVLILEGRGTFEAGQTKLEMNTGDTTWVPSGLVHRFLNESEEPLRIFWTYASIDATRTLAASGETFRIGSDQDRVAST